MYRTRIIVTPFSFVATGSPDSAPRREAARTTTTRERPERSSWSVAFAAIIIHLFMLGHASREQLEPRDGVGGHRFEDDRHNMVLMLKTDKMPEPTSGDRRSEARFTCEMLQNEAPGQIAVVVLGSMMPPGTHACRSIFSACLTRSSRFLEPSMVR